mmetsp:Transcript_65047/g.117007  ORF Transcript_65047/g.117007 Transcript_65047/m.117007 type:complete len:112 (-) Transcript_65047:174-509(-)
MTGRLINKTIAIAFSHCKCCQKQTGKTALEHQFKMAPEKATATVVVIVVVAVHLSIRQINVLGAVPSLQLTNATCVQHLASRDFKINPGSQLCGGISNQTPDCRSTTPPKE